MKSVCVYCGASYGNDPVFRNAAWELGKIIVENDLFLVYGGGKVGLMGVLAESVLIHGGKVTGIIPRFLLDMELGHENLTKMIIVETMHERKMKMQLEADAFIALPGGFGTMEEIFEVISWGQLQLHCKPCAFYNVNDYYSDVQKFLQNAVDKGFVNSQCRNLVTFDENVENIISFFKNYQHPTFDKAAMVLLETSNKNHPHSKQDLDFD